MSAAAVINRRDIDFLLREWLNVNALLARPRFASHSADSIDAIVTDPPAGIAFMDREWDAFRRARNPADAGRDSVFGRTSAHGPEYGRRDRGQFVQMLTEIGHVPYGQGTVLGAIKVVLGGGCPFGQVTPCTAVGGVATPGATAAAATPATPAPATLPSRVRRLKKSQG